MKELILGLTKLKISKKPLMIHYKSEILTKDEQLYYKNFLGRSNWHGVIISSVHNGNVDYFIMTSHKVASRKLGNQLTFICSNNNEKHLVLYRTSLKEFMKLFIDDSSLSSQVTFEDKQILINYLTEIKDIPINVVYLDNKLYLEYKDSLKEVTDINDKKILIEKFLKTKEICNVDVQYLKQDKPPVIYLNMNLDKFKNKIIMNFMVNSTSDLIDFTTMLLEVVDDSTKDELFDLLQDQGHILLENPDLNSRFVFDSSNIFDVKDDLLKINNVKALDKFNDFSRFHIIDSSLNTKLLENSRELE